MNDEIGPPVPRGETPTSAAAREEAPSLARTRARSCALSHACLKRVCVCVCVCVCAARGGRTLRVTVRDLCVRLTNHPAYLFCHLGCCEHLVCVRDVRLLHPADPQDRSAYPLPLFAKRSRTRRCDLCTARSASKVAYEDPLAPVNPCFYCAHCFGMMHEDKGGVTTSCTLRCEAGFRV